MQHEMLLPTTSGNLIVYDQGTVCSSVTQCLFLPAAFHVSYFISATSFKFFYVDCVLKYRYMERRRAGWWPLHHMISLGARVTCPSCRQLLPRYQMDTFSWASYLGLCRREEQSPLMFSIRFPIGICFRKRWVLLLKCPYSLSDLGEHRVPGSAAGTETCLDEPSLLVSQFPHYFCGTVTGMHTLFLGVTSRTWS